jgi:hypothetical protein
MHAQNRNARLVDIAQASSLSADDTELPKDNGIRDKHRCDDEPKANY